MRARRNFTFIYSIDARTFFDALLEHRDTVNPLRRWTTSGWIHAVCFIVSA